MFTMVSRRWSAITATVIHEQPEVLSLAGGHRQHRPVAADDAHPRPRPRIRPGHTPVGVVDAHPALAIDDRLGEHKTLADQPGGALVEERLLALPRLARKVVTAGDRQQH